ncbi:MAG: hypothetical protein GC185_11180 [Alphaproteobacteria bacterium]|nr:hypothetical protein [Alphaproteobacteria bacterium]
MSKSWPLFMMVLTFLLVAAGGAYAGGMPYTGNDDSAAQQAVVGADGSIRITPDRTYLLRLDQDAASVIVTNPDHASIALDTPRLLVIMPRLPGSTAFTVLDRRGQVVMEKNIIVTAVQKKYVRIRRMCTGSTSCSSDTYYYCPDGCYEVTPVQPGQGSSAPPPPIASGSSTTTGSNSDIPQEFQQQPVRVQVQPGIGPE